MNIKIITDLNKYRLRLECARTSASLAALSENDWSFVDNAILTLIDLGIDPLRPAPALKRGLSRPGVTHTEFQQACEISGFVSPSELQCIQIHSLFKPGRPWIMPFFLVLNDTTSDLINACRAVGETSQSEIDAYRKRYQLRLALADSFAEVA